MKLLIVTQAVDTEDQTLGFFVSWIREFATHAETIEVICLTKGAYSLPEHIRVHSLGKERGSMSRVQYVIRFISLIWSLRTRYDAVFVHMNQEYVLLGGWLWRILGKRVYLWRNHYAGSWLTDLAARFCTKVFCTSRASYTAKYAKTTLMPVGVDLSLFGRGSGATRRERSVLFLARVAPSKRPEMLLHALEMLKERGVDFAASFVGPVSRGHISYKADLEARVKRSSLEERITFFPGVANHDTPAIYGTHAVFVNTSPSGMFDKTLFEAAASGCMVFAQSADWRDLVGENHFFSSSEELADKIAAFFSLSQFDRDRAIAIQTEAVSKHSLKALGEAFVHALG